MFRKTPPFDESLHQLQAQRLRFNVIIGGWPTRIRNAEEGREVRKLWEKAFKDADALVKQCPDSLDAQFLVADLLRMGHNIDVPGAAQASHDLLQAICKANPTHFDAHYSLAALYIAIDPNAAPLAEKYFLKAEALAAPRVVADIYQGLGFACLYQQKFPEAITCFEKYLQLHEDARIRQMVEALKMGAKPKTHFQDVPGNSLLKPNG